jgi:hypothetical protein
LSAQNLKQLKQEIKNNIDPPTKDIQVHVVNFGKTKNKDRLFVINCVGFTITKKLFLIMDDDNIGQTITYSKKELEKKKFKLTDIIKIIKAIDGDKISFEKSSVSISDILNS